MASARRKNKFIVVKMTATDFFSTQTLEKAIVRRSKNTVKDDVKWHSIQWLRYEKEKPFEILYKTRLDEDEPFLTLSLRPKPIKGRPKTMLPDQDLLYKEPRVINALKKRDILFLLKYIPPIHHTYFKNIRSSNKADDENFLMTEEEEYVAEEKE